MGKVIVFNHISLDGFFAGPNGEIDWFIPDPEVDKAAHALMQPDTLLLGRLTYQMFNSYWPHVAADPNAPEGARTMASELDQMNKVVFSKTLNEVTWVNSRLVKGAVTLEVSKLKQGMGPDITIFGSGTIVQQLADAGLVDEYLLLVTPVLLGRGKSMFTDVKKINFKLLEARDFGSGNVLLHYQFIGM